MNAIPPLDLTQQYQQIAPEVSAAVAEVLASGQYINSAWVKSFEQQFATYVGTTHCVGCNSGTDALFLALRALNIGAGDEVITSPFTFFATAEVISAVGAKPVFVDISAETFNLDIDQLTAAITPRTKAVMPVHLFGMPMDMTRIMAIAQTHDLTVIEDCAQSTGATWQGQRVGSIGHLGCFSFFPTKNLGAAGDGGAVTTNDAALTAKIQVFRNHGQSDRYLYEAVGVNSRLDAVQAAILQIKLRHLDQWNQQRRAIANRYSERLQPFSNIIAPVEIAGGQSVWNQYTIRLTAAGQDGTYRDGVRSRLQLQGVSSMVYYPLPLHLQPVYENLGYQRGDLPVAEQLANQVLSLPMFPELLPEQQEQVVYALKEAL